LVVEEADETLFWLELLVESGIVSGSRLQDLIREATEVLSVVAAAHRTARLRTKAAHPHAKITKSTNHQIAR
jgi:hypothetical protein